MGSDVAMQWQGLGRGSAPGHLLGRVMGRRGGDTIGLGFELGVNISWVPRSVPNHY